MCQHCEHCLNKKFTCVRCGENVTVRKIPQTSEPYAMNTVTFKASPSSLHFPESFTIDLCNKCVDRFYNFLGLKTEDADMKNYVYDTFGNKLC